MKELVRYIDAADEISAIGEIVQRHHRPAFVTGFDVRLGEFDDEPALWVTFTTVGPRPNEAEARRERARELSALRAEVQQDLLENFPHRYPYFWFQDAEAVGSVRQ